MKLLWLKKKPKLLHKLIWLGRYCISHCSFIYSFIKHIYWRPLWAKIYVSFSKSHQREQTSMWKRTVVCQLKNRTFINWLIRKYMSPLFLELTLRYFCYFFYSPFLHIFLSLPPSSTSKWKTMEYNKARVLCPSLIRRDFFPLSLLHPPLFLPQPHLHYRVSNLHWSITSDCTC